MANTDVIGQTIDGKYLIERELGRGGMGTVYLGTHIGTERPVALKVIAPQFMKRPEFVERFRREARAAGRLRHPNVVDVTDFGFAETDNGRVAYLVMEYLDGCTLGEILEEEQNLPVAWTLDILEQVCSAVQEAHDQGIIHRDLKPDNIWLEPNQRGGYTVKVLDFGIAKLEAAHHVDTGEHEVRQSATPTFSGSANATFGGVDSDSTIHDSISPTMLAEAATMAGLADAKTIIQPAVPNDTPAGSEDRTAIFDTHATPENADSTGTKLMSGEGLSDSRALSTADLLNDGTLATKDLTRVGAVLGTPLYMSPEQCAGYKLDARSDIYSLGIIAYQMLSGDTPFKGDFSKVMEAHKASPPPPLTVKKVRRKMKRAIHAALDKDPERRPQSAEGFASVLRSREEGIFGLVRRALVIYMEHLPKFLTLTTFLFIPPSIFTLALLVVSFLKVSESLSDGVSNVTIALLSVGLTLANAFCGSLIFGTTAWIVTQYLVIPLRPLRLRPALLEARKKWKRFAGAGALNAVLPFLFAAIGAILGFIVGAAILGVLYLVTGSVAAIFIAGGFGGVIGGLAGFFGAYIRWMLVAPVVMMENVGIREAFRRSRILIKRSFTTAAGVAVLMFIIPAVTAGAISYVVQVSARAFDPKPVAEKTEAEKSAEPTSETPAPANEGNAPEAEGDKVEAGNKGWTWTLADKRPPRKEKDMRTRVKETVLESLTQIFWLPMQILVFSFSGIMVALLFLKTRLAGGESMHELVERFEDDEKPRKKWQERVRQRLIQSGRLTSSIKTG